MNRMDSHTKIKLFFVLFLNPTYCLTLCWLAALTLIFSQTTELQNILKYDPKHVLVLESSLHVWSFLLAPDFFAWWTLSHMCCQSMLCHPDFISDTDTWPRCLVKVCLIPQVINSSWLESSSFSSAGLLWGWRWKGIHLQGAKVHPAVWDFPEAPQALLWQVWSGERQDHPGLRQGGGCVYMTVSQVDSDCCGLRRTCYCRLQKSLPSARCVNYPTLTVLLCNQTKSHAD